MNINEKLFFIGFLASIFIFEGLGIAYGRFISIFLIVIFPILLFINSIFKKEKINLNKKLTPLLLLLFILTTFSTLFSVNLVNSLVYLIFYVAIFPVFIYTNHFKKDLSKLIIPFIFIISIFFCLFSIINNQLPVINISNGYQLVFSFFGSHNHLGDLLILPLISLFYILLSRTDITRGTFPFLSVVSSQLLIVFFTPFFLFSYSRSAYLSLILTLVIMLIYFYRTKRLKILSVVSGQPARNASQRVAGGLSVVSITIVIVLSLIFLFSVTGNSNKNKVTQTLKNNYQLGYKSPYGARGEYAREAILSTIEKPIFGVGAGNFIVASKKYNPVKGLWTESSHNIFLDIAAENGIITFIFFIILIIIILRKSEKNVFFFMAVGLLLNFQTDYTFRIFSLLLFFFILMGLAYEKNHYT